MSENLFNIEWSEITVPCSVHGEQIVKRIVAIGGKAFNQPDTPRCPVCTEEKARAEQARKRQEEEAERVERFVKASRIPLNYANYGFDDYTTDTAAQQRNLGLCRRYTTSIMERKRPGWLVFTGRPGNGKTMLLGCMARTLAVAHIATRYTTQAAMGREFRATYQRHAEISESTLFDQYAEVPVLLLDELAVFSTEGTDRVLFELLDTRYSNGRPTVLVTNHPRNRLEDVLGERLYDRLREAATFLAFDWESARKPAGQRNKTAV